MNVTCYGESGPPIFLAGTDLVAGVLSRGDIPRGNRKFPPVDCVAEPRSKSPIVEIQVAR
jgi:hypothetical protein